MTTEPPVGSTLLDPQMEADRELLLAALRRHADSLPSLLLCDLRAAADELVDPLVLPTLSHVDPADTGDLLGVVRTVRSRLRQHIRDCAGVGQMMACARAARQLAQVEQALTTPAGR